MIGLDFLGAISTQVNYYVQMLKKGYIKPGLSFVEFKKSLSGDSNVLEYSENAFKTEYSYYLQAVATGAVGAQHCGAVGMTPGYFLILFFILLFVLLVRRLAQTEKTA